jgi:hypothetical protein
MSETWHTIGRKKGGNKQANKPKSVEEPIEPSSSIGTKASEDIAFAPAVRDPKKTWGEINEEPDVGHILGIIEEGYLSCAGLSDRTKFLESIIKACFANMNKVLTAERDLINTVEEGKSTVSKLNTLANVAKQCATSSSECARTIETLASSFAKEKTAMVERLRDFVQQLSGSDSQAPEHTAPVYAPRKAPSYASTVRGLREDNSTSVGRTQMASARLAGLVDVMVPAGDSNKVPLMAIQYSPEIGVFVINLDGDVYSFGNGTFVSKKNRVGESMLYGKRCNPSIAQCNEDTCTYYHDPLHYSRGQTSRNMAVYYIMEELIKGVASDEDVARGEYAKNPFFVEDLVQLGGMLLLKAIAAKNVLNGEMVSGRRVSAARPSR